MHHTRENPSQRYRDLIEMYQKMHVEGDSSLGIAAENMFPGQSLPPHAGRIKQLIDKFSAASLLDYGSGKGRQYLPMKVDVQGLGTFSSIPEFWGVSVRCYDPAYVPHSEYPEGRFDAVVCTDVLEHCPEEDIPWIIGEFFKFGTRFVYANIACYPAKKKLPNGENAHVTIRPREWWESLFREASSKSGGTPYMVIVEEVVNDPSGPQLQASAFASEGLLG